ncbi:MAG: ABC transporter ATP-binding protein [Lachnospiraceae bacterium]|nr:ABC transporter ATP-binding protein [Lachnospiraceae bacterium]
MIQAEKKKRVIDIKNLDMKLKIENDFYNVINEVSLYVEEGEMVALVGESGCGKSMTAKAAIGLQPENSVLTGRIETDNENLLEYSEKEWEKRRGKETAMIFQEPMTALNPLIHIGKQIAENARTHGADKNEAKQRALEMMKMVGLPDVERLYRNFPCQLSGGMRQRAMIAMALINNPELLIADEPTTALDVTIQAQIMELLKEMNEKTGTAVLLISHDLGVVRNMCSRLYVMYAGHIVESGSIDEVFENPMHPYTRGLILSVPDVTKREQELVSIPGTVPSLAERKQEGCPFYDRCERRLEVCQKKACEMQDVNGHMIACHLYTGTQKEV